MESKKFDLWNPGWGFKASEKMYKTIENKSFKQLGKIPNDSRSHFLIIEVEGEFEAAEDLRNNIEKLEYPGLGMSQILSIEAMAKLTGFPGFKED